MKEIAFNTIVKNYFATHPQTCAWESKVAKGNSLPFSAVVPHQIQALERVRHGTFVFKIPDCGFQNPFDGFCLARCPAWIAIKYDKVFYLISIDAFLAERERSSRKSLTSTKASEISTISVKI